MLDNIDYRIMLDALYIVATDDSLDLSDEVAALSDDEFEQRLLALRTHFSNLEHKASHQTHNDQHQPSPIMQYFSYQHLPQLLQTISAPIGDLAKQLDDALPASAEKSVGLRSLQHDCGASEDIKKRVAAIIHPKLPISP